MFSRFVCPSQKEAALIKVTHLPYKTTCIQEYSSSSGSSVWKGKGKLNHFEGLFSTRASLVAQTVRSLPVMQEAWVQPLGWEDPRVRKIPWREWQPTPVCLSRESHGQKNFVGYTPLGCKESDITEQRTHYTTLSIRTHQSIICPEVSVATASLLSIFLCQVLLPLSRACVVPETISQQRFCMQISECIPQRTCDSWYHEWP